MLKFGDKVFVVQESKKVLVGKVFGHTSFRGVVTGYEITFPNDQSAPTKTAFVKQSVFTDEEAAKKELFKRKLKTEEAVKLPAEDKKGDRHWIAGHKRFRR